MDADKAFAKYREGSEENEQQAATTPQSPYDASFKALKEALTQFTAGGDWRIVIFIDDLDRCLPANALQVLESMKLFFDLEGVVFVVGLDQDVVEAAIDWHYRRPGIALESAGRPPISGADYLKKLFQVPFALPAVSPSQLDDFLDGLLSKSKYQKLLQVIRPHLDFITGDSGINPREIKRYINSYILQTLIDPNLDDDVSLVLLTITFRPDWQNAYQILQSRRG